MSWEGIASICALVGLIITIIGNVAVLSFFAGKIVSKLDAWTQIFTRFEKSYEINQSDEKSQRKAIWEKIDHHSEKLVEHQERIINLEGK